MVITPMTGSSSKPNAWSITNLKKITYISDTRNPETIAQMPARGLLAKGLKPQ